ncbi:hypothetical protein [Pelagibius sp.]|uniref:hypothetical protein n=1 Tax=Pelagibius sp. TaxID=1931238 RepID=UPI00260F3EDD|nr:hypothetical protein [Pelagibius sp.]
MKTIHRVSLSVSFNEKQAFGALGIQLDEGFSSFDIEESDSRWPEVERLIEGFQAIDIATTKFSAKEIKQAKHLRAVVDNYQGCPEPSDNFGYLSVTYDCSDYCPECGCGLVQKAPFRIKLRPKHGRRHIFGLNWVFDELFASTEAWEQVFKPYGLQARPILDAKSGRELERFVQLTIPQTDLSVDLTDFPSETCRHCGRTKWEPISRGHFPKLKSDCDLPLFKTTPYFGSGASAHHAVIMSPALYRAAKDAKLRGLSVMVLYSD